MRRIVLAGVATIIVAAACSPVQPGNSLCSLATREEVAAALNVPSVTMTPDRTGQCIVTPKGEVLGISWRDGQRGETIDEVRQRSNGHDVTVAGLPAYYTEVVGGILYIQKGDRTLVLQAPLNSVSRDAMIAVGNVVAPRF